MHVGPAVLAVQVDGHIPGVLDGGVRHVEEVHRPVVPELPLLVREVDLRPAEHLRKINEN